MQQKFLVSGSNGFALYDLKKGKVFLLDESEAGKFKKFAYKKEDLKPLLEENKGPYPNQVNLELTGQCNLRCRHCYGGKEFGAKGKELSTKQWKKIIGETVKLGPKLILFTGGECLLRPDFAELLEFTQKLGQKISVFSNLTTLTDKQVLALKEANAFVQFSSFGHNAKLHDSITQVPGSFEKQQASLKRLKKLGVQMRGQIVLMDENPSFKKQTKSFFQKQGIPVQFSNARPAGNLAGCTSCPSPDVEKAPASITRAFFTLKHFFNDCWAQRFVVTSQGKALACPFARGQAFGDLTKESLNQAFKRLRQNAANFSCGNIQGCRDCSLRYACMDCRPWAFSLTGKWKAKNPLCKVVA